MLMREHPSWIQGERNIWGRIFRAGGSVWYVTPSRGGPTLELLRGSGSFVPPADTFRAEDLAGASVPISLLARLASLGEVRRFPNTDLWDSIATSILRQVIRAEQAKVLYRRFCEAYGDALDTPSGHRFLFPTPDVVADLGDGNFDERGLAFKRVPLRAAAAAYLKYAADWASMRPAQLVTELQMIRRVGPWTAGATVADYSNDWSLYPYGDLAVRKWASYAAPEFTWPANEGEFASLWRSLAGEQLSTLTVLTLAWGGSHGDIG